MIPDLKGNIEHALRIAAYHHYGQRDKSGRPYIIHIMRVVVRVTNATAMKEAHVAAVLHDIVEDTDVRLNDLEWWGFNEKVIDAVDCLTRRANERGKEDYIATYIPRCKSNIIAKIVKIADLEDHLAHAKDHMEDSPSGLSQKQIDLYRLTHMFLCYEQEKEIDGEGNQ